jgi:membrane-associated phospholipid phosphatase
MRRRRRLLLYVPAAVAFARLRRRVGPPPPALTVAVVYGAPLAVAAGLPRGRLRDGAVWATHMWAYKVAFESPYDHPTRLRRRLQIERPIAIDRAIGRGMPPGQRLQRRLRRPPSLSWLDKGLTAVYLTWEAEPHLALAWLLYRHPEQFTRAAVQLGLTFDLTLAGYFATPTAPPWWASEKAGELDGEVRRVTAEVIRSLRGEPRPGSADDHSVGSNPWASWPSDHFASSLAAGLALWRADHRVGAFGLTYAACLGLALVYSGEHYVIDLVLGGSLALAVDAASRRF